MSSFEAQRSDPTRSIAEDLHEPGGALLLAFSGFAFGQPIPSFEFVGVSSDLGIHRLFARDPTQTWYHAGHDGISTDIDGTAAYLEERIREARADRVIAVGNSAGAYAAILMGTMLGADVVHAFAPYSNLSDKRYLRNQETIERVHRSFPSRYFDLRPVLEKNGGATAIHLYFDPEIVIDSWQAMHLHGLPNVYHHELPGRSHELIYLLRDSGELRKILSASVEGSSHTLDMSVVPLWQEKRETRFAKLRKLIRTALGIG